MQKDVNDCQSALALRNNMARIAGLITKFTSREIPALFKSAQSVLQSSGLDIRLAPKTLSYGRMLIVIPKRVGNAVKRNLIKRRLKNIFYQEKFYDGPYDWIILVRPEAKKLSFQEMKDLLHEVFGKNT